MEGFSAGIIFAALYLIIVFLAFFSMFGIMLGTIRAFEYCTNYIYARYSYARDRKAALTKLKERKEAVVKGSYPSWVKIKRLTWRRKGYEKGIEVSREKRWEAARKKGLATRK